MLKESFRCVFDTSLNNVIVSLQAGIYESLRDDGLRRIGGTGGDVRFSSSLARCNIGLRSESLSGVRDAGLDEGVVGSLARSLESLRNDSLGGVSDASVD